MASLKSSIPMLFPPPAPPSTSFQRQQSIHRNARENLAVAQFGKIQYAARDVVRARAGHRNYTDEILFKPIGQIHTTPVDRVTARHRSRGDRSTLRRDGSIRNHIG